VKAELANMYAEERQLWIVERARTGGRVEVAALAEELGVTTETVRRDLTTLERHALLRRVHGGAIPIERLGFDPALSDRDSVLTVEKERIARLALAELPDEGSILLDAGTTTARLAIILPSDRQLVVLTNALPIAM
jgi:DeoR family fructose operon transcriptional repressor